MEAHPDLTLFLAGLTCWLCFVTVMLHNACSLAQHECRRLERLIDDVKGDVASITAQIDSAGVESVRV